VNVSVIIPTYRRAGSLRRALASLLDQVRPPDEVIVVDNGGEGELSVSPAGLAAPTGTRIIAEPRLGLHHARNTGARAANGDLLLFTDDDATFDRRWVAAYAALFNDDAGLAAAGGTVRPEWDVPPPPFIRELMEVSMARSGMFPAYSLMDLGNRPGRLHGGVFFGVNMAIRREALIRAGGFPPEAFGSTWLGDGETGLNRVLLRLGERVGYGADAIVRHHISRERLSMDYLLLRMSNEGAAEGYAMFRTGRRTAGAAARLLLSTALREAPWWLAAPLASLVNGRRTTNLRLRAARTRGRATYLVRLLRSAEFRAWVSAEHEVEAVGALIGELKG
jgi:glucosyl-dolichyl phosphate glucuronosyltransferase